MLPRAGGECVRWSPRGRAAALLGAAALAWLPRAPAEGNPNVAARGRSSADCAYSEWSAWTACDGENHGVLEGVSARTRQVVVPEGGQGQPCTAPLFDSHLCIRDGVGLETGVVGPGATASTAEPSSLAQCIVREWQEWSSCSTLPDLSAAGAQSCGYGYQTRIRGVEQGPCRVDPAIRDAAKECELADGVAQGCQSPLGDEGSLVESRLCNTAVCNVDCQVGEWASFSACSVPCGTGVRTRTRPVTTSPGGTGTPCPLLIETENCNTALCNIDCQVSEFGAWDPCRPVAAPTPGDPLGDCTRNRTRRILTHRAGSGRVCPVLEEVENCVCSLRGMQSFAGIPARQWLLAGLLLLGFMLFGAVFCRFCCLKTSKKTRKVSRAKENGRNGSSDEEELPLRESSAVRELNTVERQQSQDDSQPLLTGTAAPAAAPVNLPMPVPQLMVPALPTLSLPPLQPVVAPALPLSLSGRR